MEILVVDDNKDFLRQMKEALYERGYTVYAADDGEEASKILNVASVDLIISDIKMPHVDGIKLHRSVRSLRQYARTKFVFLSSYRDEYSDALRLNPERDFFLEKTMGPEEIMRFVDRLMFGKFAEVWM